MIIAIPQVKATDSQMNLLADTCTNTTVYTSYAVAFGQIVVPTNMPANHIIQHTPGVMGGNACIRDTRIPVWSLVQLKKQCASDDEIKVAFAEPLTDADIIVAWDYYKNHKEEIDREIESNEAD